MFVYVQVNFDEHSVMLFKEVRNLVWLGFRVPAAIIHLSDEVRPARRVEPEQAEQSLHPCPKPIPFLARRLERTAPNTRRVGNPVTPVGGVWCVMCPVVEALPLRHGPAGYATHLPPDATGHHAGQGGAAYRTPQGTAAPLDPGMTPGHGPSAC